MNLSQCHFRELETFVKLPSRKGGKRAKITLCILQERDTEKKEEPKTSVACEENVSCQNKWQSGKTDLTKFLKGEAASLFSHKAISPFPRAGWSAQMDNPSPCCPLPWSREEESKSGSAHDPVVKAGRSAAPNPPFCHLSRQRRDDAAA